MTRNNRRAAEVEAVHGRIVFVMRFELTVPIILLLLEHKYSFGGSLNADLRNLMKKLRQSWDQWRR